MTTTTNAENLRQYKIRFFLIAEQILVFASHPDIVREVNIFVSKFQAYYLTMFYVIENFHLESQIHFIVKL